ncbi:DNA replication protein DnaC [Lachnospiraceae bacterium XBB1006]|nr:DNA replication protein DnaC [Lachnospiraceae bacterium XBB1006]
MALTNSQFDSIRREYDKRQFESRHRVTDHIEELYKRSPRIREIDRSIAALSVKQAQKLLDGDQSALKSLRSSLRTLTQEKDSLIQSLGFDLDYIEPSYHCPDCKDTGYVNGKKCHCFTQAAIDLVYTQSNLKEVLKRENFDTFDFHLFSDEVVDPVTNLTPHESMQLAVDKCKYYVEHFSAQRRNLFFTGPTGVGKTFLSNCIAKELLDHGFSVIYFTATRLFDVFHNNAYNKSSEASDTYQNIFNCDLLIIDDLGTEVSNAYTNSQLFTCINERLLRNNATIISSNYGIGEISQVYSERTFSRIMKSFDLIKLTGNDLRLIG